MRAPTSAITSTQFLKMFVALLPKLLSSAHYIEATSAITPTQKLKKFVASLPKIISSAHYIEATSAITPTQILKMFVWRPFPRLSPVPTTSSHSHNG